MKVIDLKNRYDLSVVMNNKNKSEELNVVSDLDFDFDFDSIPLVYPHGASNPLRDKVNNERSTKFDNSILNHIASTPYYPEKVSSPEEIKEKRKIIIHIKNYLREFPNCLTDFKNIDYGNKSIHQLNNYLDEIKLTVCHSNSGGILIGVFQGACDVLESVAPMVNYDLTGLKYIATKNPNVLNSVKELSLEYQNLNYISPEKRLALSMFQMCYALNSINKINQKIENKLNKTIPENISEKYIEL